MLFSTQNSFASGNTFTFLYHQFKIFICIRNGIEAFFIDSEGIENAENENFNNKIIFSLLYSFCGVFLWNSKMNDIRGSELEIIRVS